MSPVVMNLAIFVSLIVLGVAFLVLEQRSLHHAHGVWKLIATLPAMVVGWIVLGIILNPKAHTLWEIEVIVWLIPAVVALVLMRLLQTHEKEGKTA
jgi:hypothetical protein